MLQPLRAEPADRTRQSPLKVPKNDSFIIARNCNRSMARGSARPTAGHTISRTHATKNRVIINSRRIALKNYVAIRSEPLSQQHAHPVQRDEDEDEDEGFSEIDDATTEPVYLPANFDRFELPANEYETDGGRRYALCGEEKLYSFPCDEVELRRQIAFNGLLKSTLNGQFFYSPIAQHAQNILDVGTGTAEWAMDVARARQSASVKAMDFAVHPPELPPKNVEFLIMDMNGAKLDQKFDLVYLRDMGFAVKNWPSLIREYCRHLKHDGWIEVCQFDLLLCDDNGKALKGTESEATITNFFELVKKGLAALNIDFPSGNRIKEAMREANFTEIATETRYIPIGDHLNGKEMGVSWRRYWLDGLQTIALGSLKAGLRFSREECEVRLMSVRKAFKEVSGEARIPLRITFGPKPKT